MGTTIVSALFAERFRKVYFGHVGDSRAYRIRNGAIEQLTRDHSLQNEPFPNMTDAERAELPRNVITRALGMDGNVKIDLTTTDVRPGDTLLLCSDGLSSMVTDEAILRIVVGEAARPSRVREAHRGPPTTKAAKTTSRRSSSAPTSPIRRSKKRRRRRSAPTRSAA